MAIGINWKEIWKAVWAPVWTFTETEPEPEPEAPQQAVAPSYGPYKVTKKRAEAFQKILDEGVRQFKEREEAKARALDRDRSEAEAKAPKPPPKPVDAGRFIGLQRARERRQAEVLKSLRARKFKDDYPKEAVSGGSSLAPAGPKGSLSGERPVRGGIRASGAILGGLSGEHALQGVMAPLPYLTGRAAVEMEDDALAIALGMPELSEILGEFIRV